MRWRRILPALAALAALLFLLGATGSAVAATARPTPAHGRFAGEVAIGAGRAIYMECRGRGRPLVILEAGLRSRGDFWSVEAEPSQPRVVFDELARDSRVCEYDRPGTTLGSDELSRSDPVPQPRTVADAAADLAALIDAARLRGRFVLVGHSTGGMIVRLFASRHPRRVAGMVLVDALPEAMKPVLSGRNWALFRSLNEDPPAALEGYEDLETIGFDRSFRQIRRAQRRRPLRRLPLVVISRGRSSELPAGLPSSFPAALERAWAVGQDELAGLVPGAAHWVARRSGHYVMFDQPRIVIRAVGRVIGELSRKR